MPLQKHSKIVMKLKLKFIIIIRMYIYDDVSHTDAAGCSTYMSFYDYEYNVIMLIAIIYNNNIIRMLKWHQTAYFLGI